MRKEILTEVLTKITGNEMNNSHWFEKGKGGKVIAETTKTKDEAKECGDKIYLGGQCKRGHSGVRYMSNSVCVICAKSDLRARRFNTTLIGIDKDRKIKSRIDEINEDRRLRKELENY